MIPYQNEIFMGVLAIVLIAIVQMMRDLTYTEAVTLHYTKITLFSI